MEYKINTAKGDVAICLLNVADSMAKLKTTRDGTTTFHKPTYDNIHQRLCSSLVAEVELNKLKVCDCDGIEVAPEKLTTNMHIFEKYVIEPNWDEIKKQHPECEVDSSGVFNCSGVNLNLGESKPDITLSKLHCYQSTVQQLNEWGNGTNIFIANEMPADEVTFDLTDCDGNLIEAGYYRGHLGLTSAELGSAKTSSIKPPLAQPHQENEILRVISELGFNAEKLPARHAGKSGVKAKVRAELKFSKTVFDKAWERLRADRLIKEE